MSENYKHYVLIDLENVSPSNLNLLDDPKYHIKVFVGGNQNKIKFELVSAIQEMGSRGEYISISGSGKNALDFHIAYVLGNLAKSDQSAAFHIISKDTGFDPLVQFMRSKNLSIYRHEDIAQVTNPKIKSQTKGKGKAKQTLKTSEGVPQRNKAAIYTRVYDSLKGRGRSRPRKPESLHSTIKALFTPALSNKELNTVVNQLKQEGIIKATKESVAYTFK